MEEFNINSSFNFDEETREAMDEYSTKIYCRNIKKNECFFGFGRGTKRESPKEPPKELTEEQKKTNFGEYWLLKEPDILVSLNDICLIKLKLTNNKIITKLNDLFRKQQILECEELNNFFKQKNHVITDPRPIFFRLNTTSLNKGNTWIKFFKDFDSLEKHFFLYDEFLGHHRIKDYAATLWKILQEDYKLYEFPTNNHEIEFGLLLDRKNEHKICEFAKLEKLKQEKKDLETQLNILNLQIQNKNLEIRKLKIEDEHFINLIFEKHKST